MSFENEDPAMNEFKEEPVRPPPPEPPPEAAFPGHGGHDAPKTDGQPSGQPQASQRQRTGPVVVPSLWRKIRLFLGCMVGPCVTEDEYRQCITACQRCPDLDVIHRRFDDLHYCGACNCGRWYLARLDKKCRRVYHVCPRGRHPGQQQAQQGGGCSGCGG